MIFVGLHTQIFQIQLESSIIPKHLWTVVLFEFDLLQVTCQKDHRRLEAYHDDGMRERVLQAVCLERAHRRGSGGGQ